MKAYTDTDPICNSSHSDPDPGSIYPYYIVSNTQLFITQLLSSVTGTIGLKYMCSNLGFNMVNSFPFNSDVIIPAVCAAAGVAPPLQPEATLPFADQDAVDAAHNTASILFANVLAASAPTDTGLNVLCAQAPDHVANLNAEMMDGDLVQSKLCDIHEPLASTDARSMLVTWLTRYFITVVENISNTAGWGQWLCNNLDPVKLSSVGLDGYTVRMQVCLDSGLPGGS